MVERYVDHLLSRPVETVTADTALADAADELVRHDVGALVVVDDAERLTGLLTVTDFAVFAMEGTSVADGTVGDHMQTDVVTTTRQAPASEVVDAMLENRIHHVPVVEDGSVVGMVSALDVAASVRSILEP
jgi:CBS domain-containing protein